MIKIENLYITGWEPAIRGMRNPMNSWGNSDSVFVISDYTAIDILGNLSAMPEEESQLEETFIGEKDRQLMNKLAAGGPVQAKYRRMIVVYCDIIAPLYWWKEFDTYKVGTVANSCSTMHTIHKKPFDISDFSHEHLFDAETEEPNKFAAINIDGETCMYSSYGLLLMTINVLNHYRDLYLKTEDKKYWWQMIQLLPSSYNQRRTVMLNYEVLSNMYKFRRSHKLDEWRDFCKFCKWVRTLPEYMLITQGL